MVHRVDGRHPFSHYDNTLGNAVIAELEETFDLDANIYVIILGNEEWCLGLAGEKDAVAEFNFNGSFWQRGFTYLSDLAGHNLFVVAVDADGNFGEYWFVLAETSPYEITTLKEGDVITSLAFSPNGALLAYGTHSDLQDYATVALWDIETHGNKITLWQLEGEPYTAGSAYVAFSREGILATKLGPDGIKLWDVSSFATPQSPNADFDGDGTVGFTDFVQFAAKFGLSQGDAGFDAGFDLDGDGNVAFSDFVIFAASFGKGG